MKDVRMHRNDTFKMQKMYPLALIRVLTVFRKRGRFCLSTELLTHFSQEEPFDLSQKPPGLPGLRLSQSDGESVPGSSCQEEDEESLYRRSQFSPEVDQHELEEKGQGALAEPRPGGKQRQTNEKGLDQQACERESAAEEDPRGDKVQSEEISEAAREPDSELGDQADQHETGRGWSNDHVSDSELEDHHREQQEPERGREQADGFGDAGERNQGLLGVAGQRDKEVEERE